MDRGPSQRRGNDCPTPPGHSRKADILARRGIQQFKCAHHRAHRP